MGFLGRYWFYMAAGALLCWWFFTGQGPVGIVRAYFGRGARLTASHLDGAGNVLESPEQIQGQVVGALGRPVELDAVIMARVIASESPGGTVKEKAAIGWVLQNDAAAHGWTLAYTAYKAGPADNVFGSQAGRRYATTGGGTREIYDADLEIAEGIRAGRIPDPTGGATKFVHFTGYRRFRDWLADHPKVQGWIDAGVVPVALGGVGTLIVFVDSGDVLPPGGAYA